jgi:hypothetical protein
LGETFLETSERTISAADFVKRSLGGCVESVVTSFTQRFFGVVAFAADFFFADADLVAAIVSAS